MSAPPNSRRDRWIAAVLAHHRGILIFALILTVVAGLLASRLRIESDLRALLPVDHPVIESLEQIEASFVRLGSVNVVVEGGTAEQRHAYADAIAGELEALETIDDVEYRLRSDYFADHALYYLSDEEMGELDEHVQAWTHYEACSREPDLCLGEPDPKAPDQLRDFVKAKQEKALERAGFADYYERDGIDALVLLAHPIRDSSDLEFSRQVTAETRAITEAARARAEGAGLRVSVVGPYAVKADENAAIRRDMVVSGSFALLGVFLILYVLFRSFRAVFTLLIPLLCGVAWSMGATQLLLGHLNTMTSLISTVVMGMGIDAGIHFLHRVRRERQEHDDAEAITLAFRGLIIPLLIASATTLGAFVVMASSSFPAFKEFGLIAVLGVALCLLAMVTVFPALLLLVGVKLPPPEKEHGVRAGLTRALVRHPGAVFGLVLVLCGAAFFGARKVAFENNGRMLQSESRREQVERDTQLISKIFGKDIHAGILVAPSLEAARSLVAAAREKHAERVKAGDTVVAELFTASDLLPPAEIDADARKEAIETLTEDIPEHTWEKLEARADGEEGEGADKGADKDKDDGMSPADARRLRRMLKAEPVKIDEFPPTVLSKVRSKDGRYAIYAYPNFDAADIQKGVEFMEETADYVGPDQGAQFVGETTVYAAMYLMMREEAPTIIATAAGVIVILVLLQLRSLVLVVITLLPLVISVWWLLGLMGALDVRFTLFNIPILPAVLGIGVDNGVYLTDRIRRLVADAGDDGLRQALRETGAAILAATTTTALGFASFIIADSGGLKGIGLVAVIGILCAAAAAILTIPAVFALLKRLRRA